MGMFGNEYEVNRKKDLVRKEVALFEREQTLNAKESTYAERRSAETEIEKTKAGVVKAVAEATVEKAKLTNEHSAQKVEIEHERALADKDAEMAEAERISDRAVKDAEEEVAHQGVLRTRSEEVSSLKNAKTVAEGEVKSVEAQVDERKKTLGYVQQEIDSLLKQKDGEIAGYKIVVETLQMQLKYMQDVLAVAVGKIPTVDFSTFKFAIEAPAPVKGGGQDNKGGNQQKQEQKKDN